MRPFHFEEAGPRRSALMHAMMQVITVACLAAMELQAAGPRPPDDRVISVVPQKSELSAEWGERHVIWVVDAMDDPTEFVNEHGDRDAILSLVRAAISRNGSVAMGEFWYRHSQHPVPVEVSISRYPNRQSLDKNWKELSAKFDSKASTKVVGESAAWLQTTEADQTFIQNRILVFRQGLFTGWLDAVAELGEAPLLHLAEVVADKMAKVSESKVLHLGDKPEALPQSEGRQDRLPAHTTELQAGLLEAGASRTQQAPEAPLSVLFLGYTNGMGASVISNQCSRTVKVWAAAWVEVEPFSETRSDDWIWVIGPRDQYLDPGQALYWTFIPPALQGTWRLRIPWSEEDQARMVDWARGRQITDGLRAAPEYYAASAAIKQ